MALWADVVGWEQNLLGAVRRCLAPFYEPGVLGEREAPSPWHYGRVSGGPCHEASSRGRQVVEAWDVPSFLCPNRHGGQKAFSLSLASLYLFYPSAVNGMVEVHIPSLDGRPNPAENREAPRGPSGRGPSPFDQDDPKSLALHSPSVESIHPCRRSRIETTWSTGGVKEK